MRTHQNQPFVVQREVKSVMVPAGIEVTLKPGQAGYITQALGGSFTLYIDGNLFRLAGEHAEAIGQDVVKTPELSPDATLDDLKRLIWEQMATCYDPEIPINIVDLGLVYAWHLLPGRVCEGVVQGEVRHHEHDDVADEGVGGSRGDSTAAGRMVGDG